MKLKVERVKTTVGAILEEAQGEISSLTEEMVSCLAVLTKLLRDNMEGTGLENTDKFRQVDECVSALEDLDSAIGALSVEGELADLPVEYAWSHPYGKRLGRGWRANHIATALNALADALDDQEKGEDLAAEAQEVAEQVGHLEFPGMY